MSPLSWPQPPPPTCCCLKAVAAWPLVSRALCLLALARRPIAHALFSEGRFGMNLHCGMGRERGMSVGRGCGAGPASGAALGSPSLAKAQGHPARRLPLALPEATSRIMYKDGAQLAPSSEKGLDVCSWAVGDFRRFHSSCGVFLEFLDNGVGESSSGSGLSLDPSAPHFLDYRCQSVACWPLHLLSST